jgi:ubiquinone/menaquinone biosynthesis C-methylase UbiE
MKKGELMKSRGEAQFAKLPALAACLYDTMMAGDGKDHYQSIAHDIVAHVRRGKLLDVGTGPGRLLEEIAKESRGFELHGLDISAAMVERARRRLGSKMEVVCAPSTAMPYANGAFDMVVCSGSFYQWDTPILGLNEIYRVLKPGGIALLYESDRDFDEAELRDAIDKKLKDSGRIRRQIGKWLLLKQHGMTYTRAEFKEIMSKSQFAGAFEIEPLVIAGLPGWLRMKLHR